MAPTKVLNINPDFFSLKQNNHSKTLKEKKKKPTEVKSANSVRKALLAKIKDYQKKNEENKKNEKKITSEENKEDGFESEFNKSLNFLQELSNKHKNKHDKQKKTLKKQHIRNQEPIVNIDLPETLIEIPNVNTIHTNNTMPNIIPNIITNNNDFIQSQNSQLQLNQINHHIKPMIKIQTEQPTSKPILNQTHIQPIQQNVRTEPIELNVPSLSTETIYSPSPSPVQIIQPTLDIEPIQIDNLSFDDTETTSSNKDNVKNTQSNILSGGKQKHNKKSNTSISTISNTVNSININNHRMTLKTPPPYSNLKGSNKPTFREWNKTHKYPTNMPNKQVVINEPKPIKKKITKKYKTIKYNLGKKGKNIHVLIKNNHTRKKVKYELSKLKKKPILEVKDYLHQKNLIKAGTLAPNDVLREIYEQSILSGDIINENNQNLIHNFFNTKQDIF